MLPQAVCISSNSRRAGRMARCGGREGARSALGSEDVGLEGGVDRLVAEPDLQHRVVEADILQRLTERLAVQHHHGAGVRQPVHGDDVALLGLRDVDKGLTELGQLVHEFGALGLVGVRRDAGHEGLAQLVTGHLAQHAKREASRPGAFEHAGGGRLLLRQVERQRIHLDDDAHPDAGAVELELLAPDLDGVVELDAADFNGLGRSGKAQGEAQAGNPAQGMLGVLHRVSSS
mmetsp:Transcript_18198/g.43544  ORF Transcript_18198/g.43544 Transcript_18198/m.43544 type:complete len:232 (-) Transcript_18198:479-1174(-)